MQLSVAIADSGHKAAIIKMFDAHINSQVRSFMTEQCEIKRVRSF